MSRVSQERGLRPHVVNRRYQQNRKQLTLLERDMQVRSRVEKEKILLEKVDRQQVTAPGC